MVMRVLRRGVYQFKQGVSGVGANVAKRRSGAGPGVLLALMSAMTIAVAGCATARAPQSEDATSQLRHRATNVFASAWLLKPSEQSVSLGLPQTFAPLLMHEPKSGVGGDGASNQPVALAGTAPAVYAEMSTLHIENRDYVQLVYAWFYERDAGQGGSRAADLAKSNAPDEHSKAADMVTTGKMLQALRITLDRHGQPRVWEILRDSSGARQIYLSAAMEARAKALLGPPLPGRVYTAERGTGIAGNPVLVRLLEDAGTEMGPIVYVKATTHDVATVICRCMPSQAAQLAGSGYYELQPLAVARGVLPAAVWDAFTDPGVFTLRRATPREQPQGTPGTDLFRGLQVHELLRLPPDF